MIDNSFCKKNPQKLETYALYTNYSLLIEQ